VYVIWIGWSGFRQNFFCLLLRVLLEMVDIKKVERDGREEIWIGWDGRDR